MYIYQIKEESNEHFGRKMNQAVNGDRKLFWKEVSREMEERWRVVPE